MGNGLKVPQVIIKSIQDSDKNPQWFTCLLPTQVPLDGARHICTLILGLCPLATQSIPVLKLAGGRGNPGSLSVYKGCGAELKVPNIPWKPSLVLHSNWMRLLPPEHATFLSSIHSASVEGTF